MFALEAAEAVLGSVPDIEADLIAELWIRLDINGASGTVTAWLDGFELVGDHVEFNGNLEACISIVGLGDFCAPF